MGIVAPRMLPPGALIGCAVSLLCACTTQVRNMPAASNSGAAPGSSFGCVDDRGNVITAPQIVQSSGGPQLDEAALRLGKAGKSRAANDQTASPDAPGNQSATPQGTNGTNAIPRCVRIRVKFVTP